MQQIILSMAQLFRKDSSLWDQNDREQADYFFKCNQFYSRFYSEKYFNDIVQMTYYSKLDPNKSLNLVETKKVAAIVCLSGDILISRKDNEIKHRKGRRSSNSASERPSCRELIGYNATMKIGFDCQVDSLHGAVSECLFVPLSLYSRFLSARRSEKQEYIFSIFNSFFPVYQRKPIQQLAESGCQILQLRINNIVYQAGDTPQYVYLLLEGSVKIDATARRSQNQIDTMNRTLSVQDRSLKQQVKCVSAQTLIGTSDLCCLERESTVTCSSANLRMIQIPKEAYLHFSRNNIAGFRQLERKSSDLTSSPKQHQSESKKRSTKLPNIMQLYSGLKSKESSQMELKLIKNSHSLLDASFPGKSRIRRKNEDTDVPKDIMLEKIKLYRKIRPTESRLDLTNRLF